MMLKWFFGSAKGKSNPAQPPVPTIEGGAEAAISNVEISGKEPAAPIGFVAYTAADFKEYFGVSDEVAAQIALDYSDLLAFDKTSGFGAKLRAAPRDSNLAHELYRDRYAAPAHIVSGVRMFFMLVAIAREEQLRAQHLKIKKSEWMDSHAVVPPCHPGMDGKQFNPLKGARFKSQYVLPGVTLGCKCTSRPIISFD